MKILLLCWRDTIHPQGGGSERYLERVGAHLARAGHDVIYQSAAYPGAAPTDRRDGMRFRRRGGKFTVYLRAAWDLLFSRELADVDLIVDTQNGIPFFARVFSSAPTVLLTHHCHREQWPVAGPLIGRLGWFLESRVAPRVYRGCQYVTVSESSAAELVRLGIPREHITIIRNGVDSVPGEVGCGAMGELSESPVPGEVGCDSREPAGSCGAAGSREPAGSCGQRAKTRGPRLVTLSRLVPQKRIEQAIDIAAELGLPLDVIGSGWWEHKLREYAAGKPVIFHGQVSEERKHELLAHAAVHLMPSQKEGWGLAVIEAAQHGVPTVGYRSSGGLTDSVVDGETGVLVDDYAQLCDAVRALVDAPQRRAALGRAARQRAATFTWEETGRQFERLLSGLARA